MIKILNLAKPGVVTKRGTKGSGKPTIYNIDLNSEKEAYEAAKQAGKGEPVKHPPGKPGEKWHWHPTNKFGKILKNGQHFRWGKRVWSGPSIKK